MPRVHHDSSKAKRKRKLDTTAALQEATAKASENDTNESLATPKAQLTRCYKVPSRHVFGMFEGQALSLPKTLEIKNLRTYDWDSNVFVQSSWQQLKQALDAIREQRMISVSIEELYQIVEEMCFVKGQDAQLFKDLSNECQAYSEMLLSRLTETVDDMLVWLRKMEKTWCQYCDNMLMIRCIFLALDRKLPTNKSIWYVALKTFEKVILSHATVRKKCVEGLLWLVKCERNNEDVDRILMKNLFNMLDATHVYSTIFESQFLAATEAYYEVEGYRLIHEMDIPSFMNHVSGVLQKEKERAELYLDFESGIALLEAVERGLVAKHVLAMLEKGLNDMLDKSRYEQLHTLFKICQPVPDGHAQLCTAYGAYLKRVGVALVNNVENENCVVPNLLDFKDKLDRVTTISFGDSPLFVQATNDGLEQVMLECQNRPAELIGIHARFMDSKLRSGKVVMTEEDLDRLMDKVLVLFRFVPGKDMFEAFHQKLLGKRLLQAKSASFDAEKALLSKLKQECGSEFTAKLEVMFKDIELSKELNQAFKQHQDTGVWLHGRCLDMNVSVLTANSWPVCQSSHVVLPTEMRISQEQFERFYLSKHAGRRIVWEYSIGSCVLLAHFGNRSEKELQVSTYQAVVLLLFNNKDELSYREIKEMTTIEDGELQRTLQSLACGKFRVILKSPKGKDVGANDKFTFNSNFDNKLMRIKINQVQMKETAEEKEVTYEQVRQSRVYQVDATIVRIMKMKKNFSHNALISELSIQLRFQAKPSELKERIESMIDQGYLCRDKENPDMYCYIA